MCMRMWTSVCVCVCVTAVHVVVELWFKTPINSVCVLFISVLSVSECPPVGLASAWTSFVTICSLTNLLTSQWHLSAMGRNTCMQWARVERGWGFYLQLSAVTLLSLLHVAVATLLSPVEHFNLGLSLPPPHTHTH